MTRALAGVACAGLAALAGCGGGCRPAAPRACAPGAPSLLELRDGQGALTLALKRAPGATPGAPAPVDLCDPESRKVGALAQTEGGLTLTDEGGGLRLRLRRTSPADVEGTGPRGPRLRLHDEPQELRVLQPDGIPYGSVSLEGARAYVRDPATRAIAQAEVRPGGEGPSDVVLRAMDGASRAYLAPAGQPRAAALLGVPGLLPEERLALYWLVAGPR